MVFSLQDVINQLSDKVEEQEKRIKKLEAIINKDSHNFSKSPSTDNPYKKKKTKSLRKKGGKAGGKHGHGGTTLKKIESPDEIVSGTSD